jgi:hypothetical protein
VKRRVNSRGSLLTKILGPRDEYANEIIINELKYMKELEIVDLLLYRYGENGYSNGVLIELENGYIFSEQNHGISMIGNAGLFWYKNISLMEQSKGKDNIRFSTFLGKK